MIVEPPWTTLPDCTSAQTARAIPFGSTPPWLQKRRSSIATVDFATHGLTALSDTGSRFRSAGIAPSSELSAA